MLGTHLTLLENCSDGCFRGYYGRELIGSNISNNWGSCVFFDFKWLLILESRNRQAAAVSANTEWFTEGELSRQIYLPKRDLKTPSFKRSQSVNNPRNI
ncbi:MAG: hypothetical protein KME05_19190 [Gloeocapsa sp. UFS-A4-WI-NPMV-4B04]|nr:hypothetical protein [Gloeocapsa sp. UFS-A4-WI-NPMV-4B04]